MLIPVQRIEAEFSAEAANRETRKVPMTFYAGSKVLQFNWDHGVHELKLSMDPKHVRLGTLSSGRAPFTLGHADTNDPLATLGVIENARIEDGRARADVRFSSRPDVQPILNDILDGITPNTSVGARLHKLKETTQEGDKIKSFLATDWEPFAVALVGVGADPGAHFAALETETECEVELAAHRRAIPEKENKMEDTINGNPGDARVQQVAQDVLAEATLAGKVLGITEELARVKTINDTTAALRLPASFGHKHIAASTTLADFRKQAIDEQARIGVTFGGPAGSGLQFTRDESDTRRELMGAALFGLMSPKDKLKDSQNPFIGLSVLQVAQEAIRLQRGLVGVPTKDKIVELSMQSTSDFANVLENTARKQLQARYELANPTYKLWTKQSTTPDFKTMSRPRLGEAPVFQVVPEGAAITIGTMTDSKESYALASYGRGVSFTRQMLINDDLGAFNDLIGAFGAQAARLENKTVYAVLTANAAMSDGVTLFHATHANSGTGVIGNTALDSMFTAMAVQKGVDGVSVLNLSPRFLIVPKAKESTARNALMQIGPNVKASDQNWFAGRLEPVADAELDASSTAVWYAACDPGDAPGIEYAHLEGAEGPQFVRKENEGGVLGIQFYAYLDFAAKAIDWRPLYYSTGA